VRLSNLSRACSLLAAAAALVGTTGTVAAADSATLARGRDTLRAMDCARCHGRDYRGWRGPSLLAAARESTLARFRRDVLEGNPGRGMPGYQSQPLVVQQVDAVYAYLRTAALATLQRDATP